MKKCFQVNTKVKVRLGVLDCIWLEVQVSL